MFNGPRATVVADARAVSPVIGVILMVAITVIMVSVVGAFALGIGGETNDPGPTASLSTTDADESIATDRSQFVVVVHDSGDQIDTGTLKIMVRYDRNSTLVGTWSDGGWDEKGRDNFDIDGTTGYDNGVDLNGGSLSTGDTISAGDRLTWYLDDDPGSSTSPGITPGAEYRITFVDTESGSIIYDVVVAVN